ncbi:hypothetical protein NDU88_002530 [Pleurodeles waltl]|uniref:Uncharacterized protein n=1 Tax=Pleurodeles waltl TaxID=8319 RepID=A0AAV7RE24_PLEWA|nr:hypothetical protein NDU88_002530 [Pleurodeles waltl]
MSVLSGGPIGSRAAPVSPGLSEAPLQGGPQRVQRCPHSVAGSRRRSPGLGRFHRLSPAAPPAPAAARFSREAAALMGRRGRRPSHSPGGPARAATFTGPDAGPPPLRPLFSRAAGGFNARAVRAGTLGRGSQAGPSGAGPSCFRHDRSPGHAPPC